MRFEITGQPLGTVSPLIQKRIDLHQVDATCRYLSTAPLYHSAPLRYNLLVSRLGGTSIIMKKFDAEAALRLIQDERITHSQWVPTMFVRLLALAPEVRGEFDLSSHRFAIHAAAPCPKTVKHAMIEWWGDVIHEYYSGTESNRSTAISPSEWRAHPGSVGKAFHGEIKILDEQFNELPAGATGQSTLLAATPSPITKTQRKRQAHTPHKVGHPLAISATWMTRAIFTSRTGSHS